MDPFAALERFIAGIERVAESGIDDIKTEAEANVQGVVDGQYEQGVNPEGEAWAPLKSGGASHLTKSGAMRTASKAVRGVKGITVTIPKPGGFHQSGTGKMAARELVPSGDTLPPTWDAAVADAARQVVIKPFG